MSDLDLSKSNNLYKKKLEIDFVYKGSCTLSLNQKDFFCEAVTTLYYLLLPKNIFKSGKKALTGGLIFNPKFNKQSLACNYISLLNVECATNHYLSCASLKSVLVNAISRYELLTSQSQTLVSHTFYSQVFVLFGLLSIFYPTIPVLTGLSTWNLTFTSANNAKNILLTSFFKF